jgi:hypothetical protein
MMLNGSSTMRALAAAAAVGLLLSVGNAAGGSVKWSLSVSPAKGGQIVWQSSAPSRNGAVSGKGSVKFDKGAYLDLTFEAAKGYELRAVIKNGTDWTSFLDANDHFEFGPIDNAHRIQALFSPVVPTGSFELSAPVGDPDVPQMVDLTGTYAGESPTRHRRAYEFDVAMDDQGKLAVLGTLAGHATRDGGPIEASAASVRTVNGVPTVQTQGKFDGTRDGVTTSSSGSIRGPAEMQDTGAKSLVTGSFDYKANVGGVRFKDKNVPIEEIATPEHLGNLRRAWGLTIVVIERADAKGRARFYASAELTLPNGDRIVFPEKRTKYSPKKGYKLLLRKGENRSLKPAAVDKRTRVKIKGMTLDKIGSTWTPSGGRVEYRFLGQKGKTDLLDFVAR